MGRTDHGVSGAWREGEDPNRGSFLNMPQCDDQKPKTSFQAHMGLPGTQASFFPGLCPSVTVPHWGWGWALETTICLPVGCLRSLGSPEAGIDAGPAAQHLPITSRPGLALIAYTKASVGAQVAEPRLPLAPPRHGLAGDRRAGKKGRAGRGICESQLRLSGIVCEPLIWFGTMSQGNWL